MELIRLLVRYAVLLPQGGGSDGVMDKPATKRKKKEINTSPSKSNVAVAPQTLAPGNFQPSKGVLTLLGNNAREHSPFHC